MLLWHCSGTLISAGVDYICILHVGFVGYTESFCKVSSKKFCARARMSLGIIFGLVVGFVYMSALHIRIRRIVIDINIQVSKNI